MLAVAGGILCDRVKCLFEYSALTGEGYQADWVTRAPFQYPIRRLIARSREVSKPRDW